MDAFTSKNTFSATVDSKGRITVPSTVRDSNNIEPGDNVTLSLPEVKVKEFEVSGRNEALQILEELENVQEFSYSGNKLKVVIDG